MERDRVPQPELPDDDGYRPGALLRSLGVEVRDDGSVCFTEEQAQRILMPAVKREMTRRVQQQKLLEALCAVGSGENIVDFIDEQSDEAWETMARDLRQPDFTSILQRLAGAVVRAASPEAEGCADRDLMTRDGIAKLVD